MSVEAKSKALRAMSSLVNGSLRGWRAGSLFGVSFAIRRLIILDPLSDATAATSNTVQGIPPRGEYLREASARREAASSAGRPLRRQA